MKRHRNRRQSPTQKLNLVALMDIFTILVFFLMVNSSDVQIKDTHDSVALPDSKTRTLPSDTLKLYITKDYMFFENQPTQISLDSFSEASGTYPSLVSALEQQATAQGPLPKERQDVGRAITILGDQGTNYTTIQQVLASCAQTSFRDVSLAVVYKDGQGETGSTHDTNAQHAPSVIDGNHQLASTSTK